jgi:hypothetical protein
LIYANNSANLDRKRLLPISGGMAKGIRINIEYVKVAKDS